MRDWLLTELCVSALCVVLWAVLRHRFGVDYAEVVTLLVWVLVSLVGAGERLMPEREPFGGSE